MKHWWHWSKVHVLLTGVHVMQRQACKQALNTHPPCHLRSTHPHPHLSWECNVQLELEILTLLLNSCQHSADGFHASHTNPSTLCACSRQDSCLNSPFSEVTAFTLSKKLLPTNCTGGLEMPLVWSLLSTSTHTMSHLSPARRRREGEGVCWGREERIQERREECTENVGEANTGRTSVNLIATYPKNAAFPSTKHVFSPSLPL